jgi:hypothetical protein
MSFGRLIKHLSGLVSLTTLLITFVGNVNGGEERFYYQKEWGTHAFELIRQSQGDLKIQAAQAGTFSFKEDAQAIDSWQRLTCTFGDLQGMSLFPILFDQQGNQWKGTLAAQKGGNQWTPKDFVLTSPKFAQDQFSEPLKIMRIGWEVHATTSSSTILSGCRLVIDDKLNESLFEDNPVPHPFYLPQVKVDAESANVDRKTPRVFIAGGSSGFQRVSQLNSWMAWADKEFPGQFGYDVNASVYGDLAERVRLMHQHNSIAINEAHRLFPGRMAWCRNHGMSATRYDGFNPDQSIWPAADLTDRAVDFHGDDICREEVFNMTRDRMNASFDLGFDGFLIMDYGWLYIRGRWGYGDAAVAQWRKYLNGDGLTIDLVNPSATWSFADYWKNFGSIPLEPRKFGWKSWDQFVPVTEADAKRSQIDARRLRLFNALWHYHYLVFIDRLGREAEKRGKELSVSLNAEDPNNGVDMTLLARLSHLQSIGFEYFGNPIALGAWRHTLLPLRFREDGPVLDLVGEINAGGGGRESRYDRDLAYAFYYDATASSAPRYYNNQYVKNTVWTNPSSLDAAERTRFDHWFAGANAFLLRHKESSHITEELPKVTVVASRSILDYQDSSTNTLRQQTNLAPYLHALNIDFVQVGRDAWNPDRDKQTQVLFYTPAISTPDELARVKHWIATGSGKVLVIHAGSASRLDSVTERPSTSPVVWKDDSSYRDSVTPSTDIELSNAVLPHTTANDKGTFYLGSNSISTSLWNSHEDAKPVVTAKNGETLISQWNVGNNQVIHVRAELSSASLSPLGISLIQRVLELVNQSPFASYLPNWSFDRYVVPGGFSLVAWKESVLMQQKKDNLYKRVGLDAPESMTLKVAPGRQYEIYSVYEDKKQTLSSNASGDLTIALNSTPELFYYGESSPAFTRTVEAVKKVFSAVKKGTNAEMSSARSGDSTVMHLADSY